MSPSLGPLINERFHIPWGKLLLKETTQTFSFFEHLLGTGKPLSEALLFAQHGENMLCTEIVLNVKNNFCTQHVLPMF